MTPSRRSTDGDDDDHSGDRRDAVRVLNGHTRWIVGAVGVMGLSLLAYFARQDRDLVQKQLDLAVSQGYGNSQAIAVMNQRFDEVMRRLEEIKTEMQDKRK